MVENPQTLPFLSFFYLFFIPYFQGFLSSTVWMAENYLLHLKIILFNSKLFVQSNYSLQTEKNTICMSLLNCFFLLQKKTTKKLCIAKYIQSPTKSSASNRDQMTKFHL
uniref:Uncharacterized protein n=1 Tax=Ixodes ricinus TaxID=34613 RepID=A0A147BJ98_IXORI